MATKHKGTVKWFSNRKGYGFLTSPSIQQEEIFIHHSSIVAPEGSYRTLVEGTEVEFEVELEQENGKAGKLKAVKVALPGGEPLAPPPRVKQRRSIRGNNPEATPYVKNHDTEGGGGNHRSGYGQNGVRGGNRTSSKVKKGPDGKEPTPREPPFHDIIPDEIKNKIKDRGVDLALKSTVDVAFGDVRIKLGQGGYAGLAHADGTIAEGTYECDAAGKITFKWERSLTFSDGQWKPKDPALLISSVSLEDEAVGPVHVDETPEKLWGKDKTDPRDSFEQNGFLMRRVVLTRPPRNDERKD